MIINFRNFAGFLSVGLAVLIASYVFAEDANADPNIIASASDWRTLMNTPSGWNKSYVITADIDLSGILLTPVGTYAVPFRGSIDGNGHIIRNAVLNLPDDNYVGLLGYIDKGGIVSDLGIESSEITGGKYVGGLAGYVYHGQIEYCYTTGTVIGTSNVGGLVGRNIGEVNCCYSECSVTGGSKTGGLIGTNDGLYAVAMTSYSSGSVTGSDSNVGGFIGYNSGFIYSCFWDTQTSGKSGSFGGKGLTTATMKSSSVSQLAGWANRGWTINNGRDYPRLSWQNSIGTSIPQSQTIPLPGDGTENNPYRVGAAGELALLSCYASVLDKHIVLTADIDAANTSMSPIGELGPFIGDFNGAGHVIRNVTITSSGNSYVGLFGTVYKGQIYKLGLNSVNITGCNYVGGLAGCCLGGRIHSCYVTGTVNGQSDVGGLVGYSAVATKPD